MQFPGQLEEQAMFDDAGRVMFAALHAAARARLGAEHACLAPLARAAEASDAVAVAEAEAALRALPETDQAEIMAAAHAALRADPRAWLALWPGGPKPL
jgi:hypothetical protein